MPVLVDSIQSKERNSEPNRSDSSVGRNDLRNDSLDSRPNEKPRKALTPKMARSSRTHPFSIGWRDASQPRYQAVRHSTTRRKWGQWRLLNPQLASGGRRYPRISRIETRIENARKLCISLHKTIVETVPWRRSRLPADFVTSLGFPWYDSKKMPDR